MDPVLRSLGVADEGEALAAIAEFNSFLENIRSATGATKFIDVVAAVRGAQAIAGSVKELTGKDGDAAIGVLRAHKESHERLPAALDELAQTRADVESAERARLIDEAIASKGTLLASQRGWAESLTLAQLRSYLEVAVPATPGGARPVKEPKVPSAAHDGLTADELEVCRVLKQSPEQFLKSKRAMSGAGNAAAWAESDADDADDKNTNGAKSATEK